MAAKIEDGKKTYTYYPGCSSQGAGIHLDRSLHAIGRKLDYELHAIKDWNCCGASVGQVTGGSLAQMALSGRNLALGREQGGERDVVTPCAACYLNTHWVNEKLKADETTRGQVNEALGAGGLSYDASLTVRHICEVLVNDVGMDAIRDQVNNPLSGLRVAGWVGCQTVRPFAGKESGGKFDGYDQPKFLDQFTEACGAEVAPFEPKTACCGGSVSIYSPEKTLGLMRGILQAAVEAKADVISTPCPLCQQNVEMYQDAINKKFGDSFNMPVVFYSQLMAVAFGMDGKKDAALDCNMIRPEKVAVMAK
jgi:heterodisulfide reductase subunit B2